MLKQVQHDEGDLVESCYFRDKLASEEAMARHRRWHISGWPAVLLAPLIIPVFAAMKFTGWLLGRKIAAELTPRDVEGYLYDFLHGCGDEWDWDDFTSVPIADPVLESVRLKAADIPLPLTDLGISELRTLLEFVRTI